MGSLDNLGQKGEDVALSFLLGQNLSFITKNYHSRYGELDLVMGEANGDIVFVEVKYRKNEKFMPIYETISPSKQQRLVHTAEIFLEEYSIQNKNWRIDVILISSFEPLKLEWLKNAIGEF